MNFESIALLVQKKKFKINFQNGRHLGFPIQTIWAIFDLQVTLMLSTKFRVNWPFSSGEEAKNRFSSWPPTWISDRNDFSYFWSTSHPDASYQFSNKLALWFRKICEKKVWRWPHMAAILDFESKQFVCLCWGFTAQSTQWGHVQCGQFT